MRKEKREGRVTMRIYGFGPRHSSHKIGKSDCSHPWVVSCDIAYFSTMACVCGVGEWEVGKMTNR